MVVFLGSQRESEPSESSIIIIIYSTCPVRLSLCEQTAHGILTSGPYVYHLINRSFLPPVEGLIIYRLESLNTTAYKFRDMKLNMKLVMPL